MATESHPLAAGEAGYVAGGGDSFPRYAIQYPKDHFVVVEDGTPYSGLRCANYDEVIRICVSDDDPTHIRGSVSAYGGNYQVAVSLQDEQPLPPDRIEDAFFGALKHVEQLINQYGPEGNVPEVTITGRRGPGKTDQP